MRYLRAFRIVAGASWDYLAGHIDGDGWYERVSEARVSAGRSPVVPPWRRGEPGNGRREADRQ